MSLRLDMHFHRRSSRWSITTNNGTKVTFPSDHDMDELWKVHSPDCGTLFVGQVLDGPVSMFYIEVGSGSTKAQRNAFLKALAAECQ